MRTIAEFTLGRAVNSMLEHLVPPLSLYYGPEETAPWALHLNR